MRVWLIKEGEPLFTDTNARIMRTGLLAEYLSSQGHEVIWFSSTYSHGQKKYQYKKRTTIQYQKLLTLELMHSPIVYKKNISVNRILYFKRLGKAFKRRIKELKKPDIILCSYPTLEFAREAVRYGNENNVPVILDVRDLWPDIFVRAFPKCLRKASEQLLKPLNRKTEKVFRNADGIIGITPYFMQWGVKKAGREQRKADRSFYIAYKKQDMSGESVELEIDFWNHLDIRADDKVICFFGVLNRNTLDLETVITAVKKIAVVYQNIKLVICGTGDDLNYFKNLAEDCGNILFPGWVDGKQILALMTLSSLGVYPMRNLIDFRNTMGNKIIEYLSQGLPVLTCSGSFAAEFVQNNRVGAMYEEEDIESCIRMITYCFENLTNEITRTHIRKIYLDNFESELVNQKIEAYLTEIVGENTLQSSKCGMPETLFYKAKEKEL